MRLPRLSVLSIVLFSSVSQCQEIDLSRVISAAIFASAPKGIPIPGTNGALCHRDGSITGLYAIFRTARNDVSPSYKCSLSFVNIRAIPGNVTYSEVKLSPLPDSVSSQPFQYANCGPTPITINDEVSLTTTEGLSFTTSTSVTEGETTTIGGSLELPLKAVKIGMSASHVVTFSRTQSTSQVNNLQTASTINRKISITVPANTVHETKLLKKMSSGYVDFDGTVSLNGEVKMSLILRSNPQGAPPPTQVGQLSDYIPEPARNVHLKGQIWNVRGETVTRVDKETRIAVGSPICNPSTAVPENHLVIRPNSPFISSFSTSSGGIRRILTFSDGKPIDLPNSAGYVEVRVKSTGSKDCRVIFQGGDDVEFILSEPDQWSDWIPVKTHVGPSKIILHRKDDCAGALSTQVSLN
jgi:hypothetical protein